MEASTRKSRGGPRRRPPWRLLVLLPLVAVIAAVFLGSLPKPMPAVRTIPIIGIPVPDLATPVPTPTPLPAARAPRPPPEHPAGFNLLLYGDPGDYRARLSGLLWQLRADNANSLAVTFPFYQDGASSIEVRTGKDTPSDAALDGIVRIAQAEGFSVMLRPVMDEASLIPTDAGWRGSIHPASRSAWFESYGRLIGHYARLAQASGADVLDIGTELVSLESETASWKQLIADVRAVYRGQLTYSFANQPNAEFWRDLDFVGIDAYPRLSLPAAPSRDQLRAAWSAYSRQLQAMTAPKPFVVTEIGVVPDPSALAEPYRWHVTGVPDYDAQASFYAATCEALQAASVTGILWWNVGIDPGVSLFDPRGRPGEAEASACFARWPNASMEAAPRQAQRT